MHISLSPAHRLETGAGDREVAGAADPWSPSGMFASAMALLLPTAFSPTLNVAFWTPKYVLLPLLAAVGLPRLPSLLRGSTTRKPAACALAFLAWAAVSAVAAGEWTTTVFGLYRWTGGLLLVAGLVGAWALGVTLGPRDRRRATVALLVALGVNATLALAESTVDLSSFELTLFEGTRAAALMGNPVHLAGFLAGGVGLAAAWFRRSLAALGLALVLLMAALQVTGSRIAIVLAIVLALVPTVRGGWRPVAVALLALALGTGAGQAVSALGDQTSSIDRLSAGQGAGARVETWRTSLSAIGDSPLVGSGPGRFRAATSSHRTIALPRSEGADRLFYDAHNIAVEYAVTTGVVGAAALLTWLALALLRARGGLALLALALVVVHLLQPQSVGTTPVLFLALGMAAGYEARDRRRVLRRVALVTAPLSVAAAVFAGVVLVGDFRMDQAALDFELADVRRADRLLPAWAEVAELEAKLHLFEAIRLNDDPVQEERAVVSAREATRRDPTSPVLLHQLGELQLALRRPEEAGISFRESIRHDPQTVRGRVGLAQVLSSQGRHREALDLLLAALERTTLLEQRSALEVRIANAEAALAAEG